MTTTTFIIVLFTILILMLACLVLVSPQDVSASEVLREAIHKHKVIEDMTNELTDTIDARINEKKEM